MASIIFECAVTKFYHFLYIHVHGKKNTNWWHSLKKSVNTILYNFTFHNFRHSRFLCVVAIWIMLFMDCTEGWHHWSIGTSLPHRMRRWKHGEGHLVKPGRSHFLRLRFGYNAKVKSEFRLCRQSQVLTDFGFITS